MSTIWSKFSGGLGALLLVCLAPVVVAGYFVAHVWFSDDAPTTPTPSTTLAQTTPLAPTGPTEGREREAGAAGETPAGTSAPPQLVLGTLHVDGRASVSSPDGVLQLNGRSLAYLGGERIVMIAGQGRLVLASGAGELTVCAPSVVRFRADPEARGPAIELAEGMVHLNLNAGYGSRLVGAGVTLAHVAPSTREGTVAEIDVRVAASGAAKAALWAVKGDLNLANEVSAGVPLALPAGNFAKLSGTVLADVAPVGEAMSTTSAADDQQRCQIRAVAALLEPPNPGARPGQTPESVAAEETSQPSNTRAAQTGRAQARNGTSARTAIQTVNVAQVPRARSLGATRASPSTPAAGLGANANLLALLSPPPAPGASLSQPGDPGNFDPNALPAPAAGPAATPAVPASPGIVVPAPAAAAGGGNGGGSTVVESES